MSATVGPRLSLAMDPGETIEQVRAKERLLSSLQQSRRTARRHGKRSPTCGARNGFAENQASRRTSTFSALADQLLGQNGACCRRTCPRRYWNERRRSPAASCFFHWPLEFPEVFHGANGRPSPNAGVRRGDRKPAVGDAPRRTGRNHDSGALTAFARSSGVYAWQGNGHANLYQLFLERAVTLTRRGGRVGMVLPSGFAIDHGCAHLRRASWTRPQIDTFVSIENRDGLFPIHRGLKFLLMTATRGGRTAVASVPFRRAIAGGAR